MTREEAGRLEALAHRLGCSPHEVLLAAARMVDVPEVHASSVVGLLRQRPAQSSEGVGNVARLMLTAASAFGVGHVEDALASPNRPARERT